MLSLLGQEFGSRSFLYRVFVAIAILVVVLAVSIIWDKMVYTIPVLAVCLFLAAGLKGIGRDTTTQHLDEAAGKPDTDTELDVTEG